MLKYSIFAAIPFLLVHVGCDGHEDATAPWPTENVSLSAMQYTGNPSTESVILPNSLDPAALMPSDLGIHPLVISGMSSATAALVTGPNGTLIRKLLKYAASCALRSDQVVSFDWYDANDHVYHESYVGLTGLAPYWLTQALDVPDQEWITACLGARTNWYGEEIKVSMRGSSSKLNPSPGEGAQYSHREGAFWGNLFSPNPYMRACYHSPNVDYVRAAHRDCAAGHLESGMVVECGFIEIVGDCEDTCLTASNNGHYSNCVVPSQSGTDSDRTTHTITTSIR